MEDIHNSKIIEFSEQILQSKFVEKYIIFFWRFLITKTNSKWINSQDLDQEENSTAYSENLKLFAVFSQFPRIESKADLAATE